MNKQSLLFLTPKSTYYNTKSDVIKEGLNIHQEIFNEDRELYACALYFNNSTYYTKSIIIENLLKNSLYKDENKEIIEKDFRRIELEDKLIFHALMNENITHALKILLNLKNKKINNERTSKIILKFIFDRNNTDFICIKYKNKIKQLLVHALGMSKIINLLSNNEKGKKIFNKYINVYNNIFSFEIINFVFNKNINYTNKFFIEYNKISNDFKENKIERLNNTVIPIEVLEGFNSFFNRNIPLSTLFVKANVSEKQKIQMQNYVKRCTDNKIEIKLDLSKYSMFELVKYMYNKLDITESEVSEIKTLLNKKAKEISKDFILDKEDTCIIVDYSISNAGNKTSINHPMYMNYILSLVIEKFYELNNLKCKTLFVGSKVNDLGLIEPNGDTCMYKPLIEGVRNGFKNFIFLSDGFNNVGNFEEIYKAIKRIKEIKAIQFNPVFSPKDMSCKELSSLIPTIPFKDEKDIKFLQLAYIFNTNEKEFKNIVRKNILK